MSLDSIFYQRVNHSSLSGSKSMANFSKQQPNLAIDLAPFGRWTLREKTAQRRAALRF